MSPDAIEVEVSSDIHALISAGRAKDLAEDLGFSEVDQTKIAIATLELAMDIVVHAEGKGRMIIKPITEAGKVGILVMAEDKGSGIVDVEKALQGGSSTKRGFGVGLRGAKRVMDEFNIETRVGEGTMITAKKWKR